MNISQKCQYGLRAVFELARRHSSEPVRIADLAEAQAIPPRFLEVILSQMKQAGLVASRRGQEGGYLLARPAASITVGQIIRFIDGPLDPVPCIDAETKGVCRLHGDCVFLDMWDEARRAVEEVYDRTTVQTLVERDLARRSHQAADFSI